MIVVATKGVNESMHIIAVDDEKLARNRLVLALRQVFAQDTIHSYGKVTECLQGMDALCTQREKVAYAFLDIRLRGATGIELAKEIKEKSPDTAIIFVTAHNDYASEAFAVRASGYLLKPVDADAIRKAVEAIPPAVEQRKTGWMPVPADDGEEKPRLCVSTFGKFSATVERRELKFERSKSKELLALLIDKRGAGLTNGDIEAYLWEDSLGEKRKNSYVQKVISALMKTLRQAGVEDVIDKHYNYIAIRPEKVQCDLFAFLQGDASAVNSYYGIYLEDYSWAESTIGLLEQWK